MPEPAGDFLRNAAALVEGFIDQDRMARGVVMATASAEYHRPDYCPMMAIAVHLGRTIADLGEAAEVDLRPMLAKWREAAARIDAAEGPPPD